MLGHSPPGPLSQPPNATLSKQTHCPNCGVKLPDQPLSLCAYCAMPLGLDKAAVAGAGPSPNAGRIARVEQHADYAAAMAWDPPEGYTYWQGARRVFHAKSLAVVAVAALLLAALTGESTFLLRPAAVLGLLAAVASAFLWISGRRLEERATALPLLKRAGMITDRRSDTRLKGWTGSTTYHFTVEFAEGVVGEFSFPGRGSQEEPYVTNLPGVAYTRGTELMAFKHIRV